MTEYIVTTENGKIVNSEPPLPILDTDLQFINNNWLGVLYEGLQTKIPNLVHCEVVGIHPTEDVVIHSLIQL